MLILTLILNLMPALANPPELGCPAILSKLQTSHIKGSSLCELHQRYQAAAEKLAAQGVRDTSLIAELRGPRFINKPFWDQKKVEHNYNPWFMYQPAPATWMGWEKGQVHVLATVQKNLADGQIDALSLDWVKQNHRTSMGELHPNSGKFRDHGEVGLNIYRSSALTKEQQEEIKRGGGYTCHVHEGEPVFRWQATKCVEDLPISTQLRIASNQKAKVHWFYTSDYTPVAEDEFFVANDGKLKQCGYIRYAEVNDVNSELDWWVLTVNQNIDDWEQGNSDPIRDVAKIQRWFIGIHPFADGNGRTSRNIMDTLLLSLGLPAPILSDMDNDIYFTEEQWADEIGDGIIRAVEIAETCAHQAYLPGCLEVSTTPYKILPHTGPMP